jgi:hypothetical protein
MTRPNEPWPSFSPQTSWSYGMASHSAMFGGTVCKGTRRLSW